MRTFRGRGEPVGPPRAWWRATATSLSSFGIGTALAVFAILAAVSMALSPGPWPGRSVALIVFACAVAAFFLHSGFRLRSAPPKPLHADLDPRAARVTYE
ncbi:hypothetical protein FJ656_05175 [Schumannella luteola]|nr:hypothetical protein FJ656_05175 [Schumannella luteola]